MSGQPRTYPTPDTTRESLTAIGYARRRVVHGLWRDARQIMTMTPVRDTETHRGMRAICFIWLLLVAAGIWQAGPLKAALEVPFEAAARARHQANVARGLAAAQRVARAIRTFQRNIFHGIPPGYAADHWELSRNVLFEAGIEPFEGKLAVACITLNRVRSRAFPNRMKSVIWQPAQFSWTHLTKYARYRGPRARITIGKLAARHPSWRKAWNGSRRAAAQVLSGAYDCRRFAGIYHYMNPDYVTLRQRRQWRRAYAPAFRIGRHVFWKRRSAPARKQRKSS